MTGRALTSRHAHPALESAARLRLGAFRGEHLAERVDRCVEREGVEDPSALAKLLNADPAARRRFRRAVAISHSGPFRDRAQFDDLEHDLLPALLERPGTLRVWSAGCASGAELFSMAEVLERLGALERSYLLGSDLLEENVAGARSQAQPGLSGAARHRARTRWEQRDVTADGPPPGRFQLVLCRNVAIYIARAARSALERTLAEALAAGGILMLGRSEKLRTPESLGLTPVSAHVYRRAT